MKSFSIQTKFTLAFLTASLIAIGLVGIFISRFSTRQFELYIKESLIEDYSTFVKDYYQENNSLLGIRSAFRSTSPNLPNPINTFGRPGIVLVSANRVIVIGDEKNPIGTLLSTSDLTEIYPIEVEGQRIAYLAVISPTFQPSPQEIQFIQQTNRALIFASLIAIFLAILLGFLFTQTLLKPLANLNNAIGKMEKGDLLQKVEQSSNDELGEVISGFNKMSSALARANYDRKQMTADIAHELRSPLTVINGYLEALQDGSLAPTPERLGTIQGEVNQLNRLVNDLRTLALADAGQLEITKDLINIDGLFQHLTDAYKLIVSTKQISLVFTKSPQIGTIYADEGRIIQILSNLINNAIRHTDIGGSVFVSAQSNESLTTIHISDTGEGIPKDQLDSIFNRFYRVDPSRESTNGETGLGLSIVKTLVDAHNGKVSVQSQIGVGTTFIIELPNK